VSIAVPETGESVGTRYRHEAFFYAGQQEFMRGTLRFIREAVAAEEPILVVLAAAKIESLSRKLKGDARRVRFADMAAVGANPARIIPVWHEFVQEHSGEPQRLWGIGEPIWAARSDAELDECERHEALLNVAFNDPDFRLLCPYDTANLRPAVIDGARRHHPFVLDHGISQPSEAFPGVDALAVPFDKPLPEPPVDALAMEFGRDSLRDLRSVVLAHAGTSGLAADRAAALVLAANEIATNSVLHGGGGGTLQLWQTASTLVLEVRDRGVITDPLVGRERPAPASDGGRGLWLANQLCELVQIRSIPTGTLVRLQVLTS
jgi:anti-sigma regulatory factor (Ser/Thr protein kinase)